MKMNKVVLLIAIIGLMLTSCSKEESPQHPIMGKWYLNLESSTDNYEYTDDYVQYCEEHQIYSDPGMNFVLDFGNGVVGLSMSDYLHYSYWDISSSSEAEYYYQYKDGKISTGTVSYSVSNTILYWGTSRLSILTLDNENMELQYVDTLYYRNDNGEEQISCVKTRDFVFGRTHIPPTGDEPGDDPWSDPNPG